MTPELRAVPTGAALTSFHDVLLLVEDNPGDALLVREALGGTGASLRHVSSLAEAIVVARQEQPSCVLLDLDLPDASGLDGLGRLRDADLDVPVVVLTGRRSPGLGEAALEAGAQDFLVKGAVDGDALRRSIRYAQEGHRSQAQLRASEQRYRTLLAHLSDVVLVLTDDAQVRYATPSVVNVLGVDDSDDLLGTCPFDLVHPDDRPLVESAFHDWRRDQRTRERVTCRVRHGDGGWRVVELSGRNLLRDPVVEGLVVTAYDITDRRRAEQAREHQALHDELTGLPNRALFANRLDHALERAGRDLSPVAVLFLDLDRFKVVNDTFGHVAGDEVLQAVAGLLSVTVRPGDTVARFGGDEFVVLCEGAGADEARSISERIVAALSRPFGAVGNQVYLGVSAGIAVAPPDKITSAADLLRDADTALYKAKQDGRGRWVLFDGELRTRTLHRARIEEALRRAVDANQLFLAYQPKVALADGRVLGFEALLRWEHPDLGLVPPAEFIPIAEETGLIRDFGRWVLAEACRQLAEWNATISGADVTVAVNVSAHQLSDPDFAAQVAEAIEAAGVRPGDVCLEITESTVMENAELSTRTLRMLKAVGVHISVDDFGTGYSSLAYLKRFPLDELKIDRAFVKGLGRDPEDSVIVASVVHLARSLGISVVAEGVEHQDQLDYLAKLGCDLGQGYFWAKPERPAVAGALIGSLLARPRHEPPAVLSRLSLEPVQGLGAVAHELRTPLTVIRGYTEILENLTKPQHTDQLWRALEAMNRQAVDMEHIVSMLAETSEIDGGRMLLAGDSFALHELVRDLVDELRAARFDREVGLTGEAWAVGDVRRTRQIVRNLLTNAAKFSPDGSPIELTVAEEELMAVLTVVDHGAGVPEDRRGELFQKFSRLGTTKRGVGLGLYLSRRLAIAQGGSLDHRPAETGGACFELLLPRPDRGELARSADEGDESIGSDESAAALSGPAAVRGEVIRALDDLHRGLTRIHAAEEAVGLLIRLVRAAGGQVVPQGPPTEERMPLDLSLGVGPSLWAVASPGSSARAQLDQVMPDALQAAERAVAALHPAADPAPEGIDATTGLCHRSWLVDTVDVLGSSIDLLVVGLPAGTEEGTMCRFSRALREVVDPDVLLARWGRERFVVAASAGTGLEEVAERLRGRWLVHQPNSPVPTAMVVACGISGRAAHRALLDAGRDLARAAQQPGPLVKR